jgi:ribosomal protein S20
MSNKIDELIGTGVIEKTKADYIKEKFQDFTQSIEEWSEKAKAIVVTDESQKEIMTEAREGRLLLKSKRIEVEKVRKSLKEQSLSEGRLIDSVAKYLTSLIEPAEKHLELQEKFVEIQEQNKRAKLKEDRIKLLAPYSEVIDAYSIQLDLITEEAFTTILNGSKLALENKRKEVERLELEALENKRKENLFQERRLQIVEYKKYYNAETNLILNLETSENDFKSLLNSLIERQEQEIVKQKNIEKENEKLKKQNLDNKKEISELKTIIKIEQTPPAEAPTTIIKREVADKDSFGADSVEELITIKKREYEILKTRYGIAKTALESVLYFIVPVNLRDLVNNAMRDIAEADKQ